MAENFFRYRVIIPYREPTFALHKRGLSPETVYLAAYNVTAENKTEAINRALDLFKKDARDSSVHWLRVPQIKDIIVEKNKVSKILVVDNNAVPREYIQRALKQEGYEVTTAERGGEALEILANNSFDLIATDIAMPGMNGLQLIKIIKKILPDIPVIIITAFLSKDMAEETLSAGAYDMVLKPVDTEKLKSAVRRALSKDNVD